MIEISNVSKAYGDSVVVDHVSLNIPRGGVTALIGPNGAGKSTLLSMISRILPMTEGRITVDGLDVTHTPGRTLARKLSFLRQNNAISMRLSVRDLVAFGRYPYSGGRLSPEDRHHIADAMAFLELEHIAGRFLDELSGGQCQRAFVAMVLCQSTDYVLLDEPLNNLDLRHAVDMMKLVRRLADAFSKTIIVVLHDINFAAHYSDSIVALKNGRIVHQGTPSEVMTKEKLRDIYDLDMAIETIGDIRVAMYYL